MKEKLVTLLSNNSYALNEEIEATCDAIVAAEQNDDHDIDAQTYLNALYVLGKKYEAEENVKATRYIAMKMQSIFDAFPMIDAAYSQQLLDFVKEHQTFLQEKYAIMDKTLRKSTLLNIVVLSLITFFFMRFNLFVCIAMGTGIALLMYKMMGKKMHKKLDGKIMENYQTALREEDGSFISQKVYL